MKIIIQGDSSDISYRKLSTFLRHFNLQRKLNMNINGLKYKGTIETICYESSLYNSCRVITLNIITETELIDKLFIGDKNGI